MGRILGSWLDERTSYLRGSKISPHFQGSVMPSCMPPFTAANSHRIFKVQSEAAMTLLFASIQAMSQERADDG